MPPRKRASAKEKQDAAASRANAPTQDEYDTYFDRLHEINDRMDEDRATHMTDMNAVYDEAAKELDMPKEVVAAMYKQDRKERKALAKVAKSDSRTREAFAKASQAYGEESPLGQWCARMAAAGGAAAATKEDKGEG